MRELRAMAKREHSLEKTEKKDKAMVATIKGKWITQGRITESKWKRGDEQYHMLWGDQENEDGENVIAFRIKQFTSNLFKLSGGQWEEAGVQGWGRGNGMMSGSIFHSERLAGKGKREQYRSWRAQQDPAKVFPRGREGTCACLEYI